MAGKQYFTPSTFRFLKELSLNNNREWFLKNKKRYEEDVQQASLKFIHDAKAELKTVSPYLVGDEKLVGGSLFRIYRDLRFSKDKTPYKTNVAMHFWHAKQKGSGSPGLYLSMSPGSTYLGSGCWHADNSTIGKVRTAIVEHPSEWNKVRTAKAFKLDDDEGSKLKRPPPGFDPNNKFIEDIKRRDFVAGTRFTERQVTSDKFMQEFLEAAKGLDPLNRFLAQALGLAW